MFHFPPYLKKKYVYYVLNIFETHMKYRIGYYFQNYFVTVMNMIHHVRIGRWNTLGNYIKILIIN